MRCPRPPCLRPPLSPQTSREERKRHTKRLSAACCIVSWGQHLAGSAWRCPSTIQKKKNGRIQKRRRLLALLFQERCTDVACVCVCVARRTARTLETSALPWRLQDHALFFFGSSVWLSPLRLGRFCAALPCVNAGFNINVKRTLRAAPALPLSLLMRVLFFFSIWRLRG